MKDFLIILILNPPLPDYNASKQPPSTVGGVLLGLCRPHSGPRAEQPGRHAAASAACSKQQAEPPILPVSSRLRHLKSSRKIKIILAKLTTANAMQIIPIPGYIHSEKTFLSPYTCYSHPSGYPLCYVSHTRINIVSRCFPFDCS